MKKIVACIAGIIAIIFLASSCVSNTESISQVISPSGEVAIEVQSTPQPTENEPVTREDISPYFMPGLSDIGIVPQNQYKIGIILSQTDQESSWLQETCTICSEYSEKFALEIATETVGADIQEQIDMVASMVSDGIDFLIFSPSEPNTMEEAGDLCEQQGIPYITVGNRIAKTPGEDGYICTIEQDDYMIGVLTGIAVVQAMTEKYGEPMGNIGEITGQVDDQASILWSMGVRRVLSQYENLNVVCSVAGDYDTDTSYQAAVNLLKAFREDELDGIITVDDATGLQALQALLDLDRNELVGSIWSVGATKDGLTCVWYGDFAQTVESTCHTGMVALEYALQYLEGNGDNIPSVISSVTRVFSAETIEKADGIAALIAEMGSKGTTVCFENIGEYDLFLPDTEQLDQYYPKHYYEYDDIDAYLSELEPYTTGEAMYGLTEE